MPAAMLASVMANVNRDPEKHPDPYTAEQFMPGAKDEMLEFIEALERGDEFEVDPKAMAVFRQALEANFSNVK